MPNINIDILIDIQTSQIAISSVYNTGVISVDKHLLKSAAIYSYECVNISYRNSTFYMVIGIPVLGELTTSI